MSYKWRHKTDFCNDSLNYANGFVFCILLYMGLILQSFILYSGMYNINKYKNIEVNHKNL